MNINTLAVIGAGLIGGSLIRALRDTNALGRVVVYARTPEKMGAAVKLGWVDQVETTLAATVVDADVIVIATPPALVAGFVAEVLEHCKSGAVITDVGSIKGEIVQELIRTLGNVPEHFVPGHPIAGTEKSGIDAALSRLYVGRTVIVTPLPNTEAQALATVTMMWQSAGAEVVTMDVAQHDAVLAATSHLPHVLAYALVNQLSQMSTVEDVFRFAAGGFRDFSRIASSDPIMWRDICLGNHEAITQMLSEYITSLQSLQKKIASQDAQGLLDFFQHAKKSRDAHFE
jgi:prephenate dehydrogenase